MPAPAWRIVIRNYWRAILGSMALLLLAYHFLTPRWFSLGTNDSVWIVLAGVAYLFLVQLSEILSGE